MQTHYFNAKTSIKISSPPLSQIALSKELKQLQAIDEDLSSENELNLGFIAQQSKLLHSDSLSVISDGISISGISSIRANARINSPHIFSKLEEEFSGMEEWSVDHQFTFAKKNLKRPNPSIDEEQSQEDIDNRCTKRKMNDKMRVVTINTSKNIQKFHHSGYLLRSRVKAMDPSESSSNEDLRSMLDDIQEPQIQPNHYKNRLRER